MAETGLDLNSARELFESSTDFTIGLEEEFAIVDPSSLDLVNRFEDLFGACQGDDLLAKSAAGELIASEIEIRSGKSATFAAAMERQREHRARLFGLADSLGLGLAATGAHPWAHYLDQRIIDTPHYRRLERDLGWVAQRNNTWSLHLHMGIRGADRAIAVCDWMRELLPVLLAASANSPFLDDRNTGLHSIRTEIFTRTFPRCGVHDPFGDWASYASFVEMLARTNSIVESTQLWWSVRPHHRFGTVEVRICDAQSRGDESFALAALIAACIAQTAMDYDERGYGEPLRQREVEENLWRAIRYGMDGSHIDFRAPGGPRETPVREVLERITEWTAPARKALGLEVTLPKANGAQRALASLGEGRSIADVYRESVQETRDTYAGDGTSAKVSGTSSSDG